MFPPASMGFTVRNSLMRRVMRVLVAVKALALTVLPLHTQPFESDTATHTSSRASIVVGRNRHYTDSTVAEVFVHDRSGRAVHGLAWHSQRSPQHAMASFWRDTVLPDLGLPFGVDSCSVVGFALPRSTTFAVGFVLDHSPSMTTPRAVRMQRAVHAAVRRMHHDDAVAIVKFTSSVRVEVPCMTDKPTALETFRINGVNSREDGTAIYDGVYRALHEVDRAADTQRRVLLVFTDGDDNASTVTLDSVIHAARQRNAAIHVVTYGMTEQPDMIRLASATGGGVHALFDVYGIDSIFSALYDGLRSGYTVRVWHEPHDDAAQRGAITTMETAHGSDRPTLELIPMLPTVGVEILQGPSDPYTLAIAVASDALQRPRTDELQNEGVTGLAWMMRRVPEVVLEIMQPAASGPDVPDPYERIREQMVLAGVAPHRIIRGSTSVERLGITSGVRSDSVLMRLYRQ